jgi:hypothetical protein
MPAPIGFLKRLAHRALDFTRRLRPAHKSPYPPTWPIDPGDAAQLVVEWPTRYENDTIDKWFANLRAGFGRLVPIVWADIPQHHKGLVRFHLLWHGRRHPVTIDYSDQMARIVDEAIGDSLAYFKFQCLRDGYGGLDVIPGGYVNAPTFYRYLPMLRCLKTGGPPRFDVYGRFNLEFAADIRGQAVRLLSEQTQFRYEGSARVVRYYQSLRESAQAKIGIDMPGNGDFCFRLLDYLGIGTFVIAYPHRTMFHVPIEDRRHLVYCKHDQSDLVERCAYYVQHPEERERIAANALEYFDRYLHRDQLAGYYLARCLQRLKGRPE